MATQMAQRMPAACLQSAHHEVAQGTDSMLMLLWGLAMLRFKNLSGYWSALPCFGCSLYRLK